MSIAQVTVMSTPELLEHTLAHLSMRDLLITAPLVSKTWHSVTLTPTLQRILFFQTDTNFSCRVENPLLAELFPPFFTSEASDHWSSPNSKSIESMSWAKAPDVFRRPEASWRRMLVTQPPAPRLVVTERCHGQVGDFMRRAVLNDPCLRMGVLHDLVLPFIDRVASSFCIGWHQDSDVEDCRDDIILAITFIRQCCPSARTMIDARFYSDAAEAVGIKFGERVAVPRE
ncbi:hypothetical protein B0H12DRAFT_286447 [Mycena haematopus]|nr:hypothetical protein B0H12DRAFT_286447 [Mycena haematopus]